MKSIIALICFAALANAYNYNNVTVKNLRLFDGNNEYFIKSICYSPAPPGYAFGVPNQGTGVCKLRQQYALSANEKPLQSISACYYEDFFDGSVDPTGEGNQQGWFKDLWTRDLPVIASTGANVVRFYHTNPITKELVYKDSGYQYKGYGSDYVPFMDACHALGLKVVFPLFAEYSQIVNFPQAKMEEYVRSLVDNVGNHPALLMWQFGNELPIADPNLGPTLLVKLNHFFDYARSYTFYKYQRHVPISIALVDLPFAYNQLSRDLKVDVMTTNAGYRGPTYSDLWFGAPQNNFDGLHSLACQYGKPAFIGEIGQHSSDGYYNDPNWFPQNWDALLANYKNGAIGGALFEYSDEAWKADNQRTMGIVKLDTDTHVELKQGSGAYNFDQITKAFKRDIFAEMGRAPYTLDNVDNTVCAGFNFAPLSWPLYPFIDIGNPNTDTPSTYTTPPPPTQNQNTGAGGNGGSTTPVGPCGAGLSQCGAACYKEAEYCCRDSQLYTVNNDLCKTTPQTSSSTSPNQQTSSSSASPQETSPQATQSSNTQSPVVTSSTATPRTSSTSVVGVTETVVVQSSSTFNRLQGSASKTTAVAVLAAFVLLAIV